MLPPLVDWRALWFVPGYRFNWQFVYVPGVMIALPTRRSARYSLILV
jgi:hypothetical protein